MEDIIQNQVKYFESNITRNIDFRINKLKKLDAILKDNISLLDEAIYKDFKKSPFENYNTELALLFLEIKDAVKNLKNWSAKKRVSTSILNQPGKSYIIPEPLGVCLVISAWNYPYQISLAPVIAAIAAGNTVILKPSELSSHTSAALAKIINNNFDTGFFHVVEGDREVTSELLKYKFDKIFFTGSVSVGKIIYAAAAKHLTPVTLELGGKSPAIITESANIKLSAKRLIWSKFLNAGQTCIAPDYLLVHKSIKDAYLNALVEEIKKADYKIENDNYVQIINNNHVSRLSKLIDRNKIFYGGNIDEQNRIIEPTILDHVSFDDEVMKDEIFGPILPIIEYEDLNEAISKIKSRPKPLSLYLYTNDETQKNKILEEISFGGGCVNDSVMHISNSNLPFGGVGDSGIGSYHSEAGFRAFSHYKGVLEKYNWFESNIKYSPYSTSKFNLIKKLLPFI
jgi:aldehyde dehydrogenase (NAD+)